MSTFSPYPGSIGCEKASPARSTLVQVFTGSPFLDTGSTVGRRHARGNALIGRTPPRVGGDVGCNAALQRVNRLHGSCIPGETARPARRPPPGPLSHRPAGDLNAGLGCTLRFQYQARMPELPGGGREDKVAVTIRQALPPVPCGDSGCSISACWAPCRAW